MKMLAISILILGTWIGFNSKAEVPNLSGRWQIRSCKGIWRCVGVIVIRQTTDSIAIEGSISLASEQRVFFLPKLIISAGDLIDQENHGKISGEIGPGGFVHSPVGYKKFVVKNLPNGQIAFETSDNNSQTIYGIAEKN